MQKFVIRKINNDNYPEVIVNYSFTGDHRQLQMELTVKDDILEDFIVKSLAKLYRLEELQVCCTGKCYKYNKGNITSFNLYRRK